MSSFALPRRTLRSGKEFSAFDLAVGRAITPASHFSVGDCLKQRLVEQEVTGLFHEEEESIDDSLPLPPSPPDTPAPSPAPTHAASSSPSADERNKMKGRRRRNNKRDDARAASNNPLLKSVHSKRLNQGKSAALELDIDAGELPHSKPAWLGSRSAEEAEFEFHDPQPPHHLDTGLGGVSYTQEQVDALSGTEGFMYIGWLGALTIPLLDSQRRVIALLGGMPRDLAGWKTVTDGASRLLQERASRIRLTEERLHHRRAEDAFPAIARGLSHGGGQTEPGELHNNVANTKLTDELLAHDYFRRIAQFANILFALWAPLLFTFYQANLLLLDGWKLIRRNFAGSVFAACTFNFGPRAITAPHLDFANLSWGWCAITALGDFDPDVGGHLILWDLRLVIRFPPGSTILLPSALIRHSNVGIRAHEHRSSFTQYTAGGLFRWVRNGFKTDEDFEISSSASEKAARNAENKGRWEEGMKMFSVIDEL